ncbi:MAG: hypothetical protein M3081_09395 [Gemmatimonadota bacterium]|nr:hypothetical protein [Gemmatimonadota bacterium]
MVELRTFGRLELVGGETSATHVLAVQPKRLALLAYLTLATPRGPHRREALLALFWPELNQDDGRRALRQALHALRHQLGDGVIESGRDDRVGVTAGDFSCDAIAFEAALDELRSADALALYQGDFLDGVFVSDVSPDFEQWVDLTRARLRGRATIAASDLAAEARQAGDRTAEIRRATEACRLAPDDEPRVRALMRALRDSGDRAGALRVFQQFTQRMSEEFDAEPAAQTLALADAMRSAPPLTDTIPTKSLESPSPSTAPLDAPKEGVAESLVAADRSPPPAKRWRWAAAVGVAAALALGAFFATRGRATTGVDGLLVADFGNHTRDSLLAGAVTEALRADLSQSRLTRVMSRTQVQAVLLLMKHPPGEVVSDALVREVAERYGVKAFVTGDVAALGTGFTVSAALISVKGGEILVSVRESAADSTKLLGVVNNVSDQLRRGVGESLWSVRASPSLEQVTTSSLQALRLYSQAIRVGDQDGDWHRAVVSLRQAIALDTSFAMAYRKLGVYLRDAGDRAAAEDALAKAFRFRDRLPEIEKYHAAGMYYLNVFLPDSAIAAYRMLLSLYPNDARALNNIGDVYEDLRDYARGETFFHKAIESDSSISVLYEHLATDQFNGSRYDEATQTLAARARRFPQQQNAELIEVSIEMMRGDFDGARAHAERMLAAATPDLDSRPEILKVLSTLSIDRGHLADADRYQRTLQQMQVAGGAGGDYLTAAIARALIDIWDRHDAVRGLALLDSSIARFPLPSIAPLDRNYGLLAYTYALGGRPARARELLAEMRANESLPVATRGGLNLRDEGGYLRALGAAELAEGHTSDAVRTLRRSVDLYFCPTCSLPDLGRALEQAGARDSAIAVYERYVVTPWSEWQNAGGEYRVSSYQRLGALYEASGDTARAIRAYEKVAALWSGADAELQSEVAGARQRAAVLRTAMGRASR